MALTYDFIAKITTTGSANSVSFTSITQTYTDLVLVYSPISASSDSYTYFYINNDTSTTCYRMSMYGNGASFVGSYNTDANGIVYPYYGTYNSPSSQTLMMSHFMNYSSSNTGKLILTRSGNTGASNITDFTTSYYPSNTAITRIDVLQGGQNFAANVVFSLYGIKAA